MFRFSFSFISEHIQTLREEEREMKRKKLEEIQLDMKLAKEHKSSIIEKEKIFDKNILSEQNKKEKEEEKERLNIQ